MGYCELCGSESNNLIKVRTDGSVMNACGECSRLGRAVKEKGKQTYSHTFTQRKRVTKIGVKVIPNYASKINSEMGKRGINFKQLANTLNIKDTTLQKYLTGKLKMDVETARRFENYFEIKLTEEVERNGTGVGDFLEDENLVVSDSEAKNTGFGSLGDLLLQKLNERKK